MIPESRHHRLKAVANTGRLKPAEVRRSSQWFIGAQKPAEIRRGSSARF